MEDTEIFLNRYQNHIQTTGFGVPGQKALMNSRMLIFGAGALSTPMLSYLTSMGVGQLGIVSTDQVKKSDLPAQPIFASSEEGKLKSQLLASRLRDINPEARIILHEQGINSDSILNIIADYDLVIDTTNVPGKSLLINDACVISGIPLIYGTLNFPSGSFSVLNYRKGATLRCLIQNPDSALLIQHTENGGLAILPALISCMMANEAIKVVSEIGNIANNKLLSFNVFSNQLTSIKVEPVAEYQTLTSLQPPYGSVESENHSEASRIRSISPKLLDLKIKYNEPLQLIDISEHPVRIEAEAWNCLHIPEQRLLSDLEQIHQDIIVVLISPDGESAKKLTSRLNERHGFANIHYLEGGMQAWNRQADNTFI